MDSFKNKIRKLILLCSVLLISLSIYTLKSSKLETSKRSVQIITCNCPENTTGSPPCCQCEGCTNTCDGERYSNSCE